MVFLFPETKFRRPEGDVLQRQYTLAGLRQNQGLGKENLDSNRIDHKTSASDEVEVIGKNGQHINDLERSLTPHIELKHDGYPSTRQKYGLIGKPDPLVLQTIWRDIFTPVKLFIFPIVLWSSFCLCFYSNCVLDVNLTQSEVFSPPPYLFSPADVGFTNFAFLGGALFGLLTAGPISDFISAWSTRLNGGIREPEMRLPTLIPFIVAMMVGMIVSMKYWLKNSERATIRD
jgi:hypothetical protein